MVTIKSYTDISQSKKLAEILPLESADMHYCLEQRDVATGYEIGVTNFNFAKKIKGKCNIVDVQPAWSLASLLGVLPEIDGSPLNIERVKAKDGYDGYYYHIEYKDKILIPYSKNPIDACVTMIERLHERKML